MSGIVRMSNKELNRVPILENVIKGNITRIEGAKQAGLSVRQFGRLKKVFSRMGVAGLKHKLRDKKSNNAIPQEDIDKAIDIIKEEYQNFGPTFALEKLWASHGVTFSVETLRKAMIQARIHQTNPRRYADIHQMRDRREQFGELVQTDGSPHLWFEERGEYCTLLVFIDDATGKLLWLAFAESETTHAYFMALNGYLTLFGKPLSLYVDKHGVFRVNTTKLGSASVTDSNGITQFGRAMKQLDIELIYANSPQAKGRVERVNQTLQDRLVKELRLRNICTIEEGNKYLPEFIKEFNAKFSVQPKSAIDAHRPLLLQDNLQSILCSRNYRIVSRNLTIQYENKTYMIKTKPRAEFALRKAKIEVIETLDGQVRLEYLNKDLVYQSMNKEYNQMECDSKQVNYQVEKVKKKQGKRIQFNLFGGTFLLWRE